MRRILTLAIVTLTGTAVLAGEPVSFTAKPTVARDGEKVKISFAVSAPTDVAVYIEDSKGQVVRHLAAGVLGQNPPPPLKPGLAQEVVWDGKADYGKPAGGEPFKARVALGLGAKCDKVFSRPEVFSGNCTLGVGPDGALYVQEASMPAGGRWGHRRLVVLNRDGSYRRTLLPYASTPSGEGARGLPAITLQGRLAPAGRESETDLLPWLGASPTSTMAVSPDGQTLYLPVCGGNPFRPAEVMLVSTGGGGIAGRHLLDKAKIGALPEFGARAHMAVSSDGKSLFMLGLRDRRGKGEPAAVYRVRLPDFSELDVFFGERYAPGKDATHLGTTAGGLATDGKGNLLICDTANNRVVVVGEADGKLKGEFACDAPWNVGVHRASGAVYVASQGKAGATLAKFKSWQDAARVCEMPIPRKGTGADAVNMAVDGATERAVIWLVSTRCGYLVRAEDAGTKFEVADVGGPYESLPGNRHEFGYLGLAVDRSSGDVYVRNSGVGEYWERIDEATGKSEFLSIPDLKGGGGSGGQIMPGADGFLYALKWRHKFSKYDRSGKPVVMAEPRVPSEAEVAMYPEKPARPGPAPIAFARVGMTEMPHTMGIRWSDGHIFVLEPHMITQGDGGRIPKALHEYLPSGKRVTTVDNPIIWKTSDPVVGPRFDAAGNIYIAEIVRPKGWRQPPEWTAFLASKDSAAVPGLAGRLPNLYGSIVKFSPKGGMIHFDGVDPFTGQPRLDPGLKVVEADYPTGSGNLKPVKVTGAEWIHPGVGHVGTYACNCENMTFDVDEFGRVFFADQCMYTVRVIDTAGNALTTIGGYGNADNCGPESAVMDPRTGQPRPRRADDPKDMRSPFAEPDIAMAWPTGVAATDRHIYVADSLSRRLVRGRVAYAAEETCAIP